MSEPLVLGNQAEKTLGASKEIQEIKLTVDSIFKIVIFLQHHA